MKRYCIRNILNSRTKTMNIGEYLKIKLTFITSGILKSPRKQLHIQCVGDEQTARKRLLSSDQTIRRIIILLLIAVQYYCSYLPYRVRHGKYECCLF